MRIVIYDNESFEPITVINLPGMAERDIVSHGRHWRVVVPVPVQLGISEVTRTAPPRYEPIPTVDLWFEPLVRDGPYGEQRHWLCFTDAADLAMKLNPSWLPGQRPAIDELQRQNDRLTELVLRGALS